MFLLILGPVLLALLVPAARAQAGAGLQLVTGQELVQELGSGHHVDLVGATIQGDVDLRPIAQVRVPLRCWRCTFQGSIEAQDVVFQRLVDFSESVVKGRLDLLGAMFGDRATFDQVMFESDVVATSARFSDKVSFTHAEFQGEATLDRASMLRDGVFGDCKFLKKASFRGVDFGGRADFSVCNFADALFEGSAFSNGVSFSIARFMGNADFSRINVRRGANFQLTAFGRDATFDRSSFEGPVTFDSSIWERQFGFASVTSSGTVSFLGVRAPRGQVFMDSTLAGGLLMAPQTVLRSVAGSATQLDLLAQVERTAKAGGDLGTANRARFERLSLLGQRREGINRFFDLRIYRDVLGYLVRPGTPLRVLVILLAATSVLRAAPLFGLPAMRDWQTQRRLLQTGRRPHAWFVRRVVRRLRLFDLLRRLERRNPSLHRAGVAARRRLVRLGRQLVVPFTALTESAKVVIQKRPVITIRSPDSLSSLCFGAALWVEFLAYKFLVVVFLLALGSANSTVRGILDAVLNRL